MPLKVTDKQLLEELLENHNDFSEDPNLYRTAKDIAEKYGMASNSISRRLRNLQEEGLVKINDEKTSDKRSMGTPRAIVYTLTIEGLEAGGLASKFERITEGPDTSPLSSTLSLADLHGDLQISFEVTDTPEEEPFEWRENPLPNGVIQKCRTMYRFGDQISIEFFDGPKNKRVVLKPTLIAKQHDTPEDLIQAFADAAEGIWKDFEHAGYELKEPEQKGEGKFTLRSSALKDIGFYEGDNLMFDKSKGLTELHFRTGSAKGNMYATQMASEIENKSIEVMTEQELVQLFEKIGGLGELVTIVQNIENRLESTEKKTELNLKYIDKAVTILDKITTDGEEQPDYSPPDTDPGGHIYG